MLPDKSYRYLFSDDGIPVAKAWVDINGNNKDGYRSKLKIVPDLDFLTTDVSNNDAFIDKILDRRYPDLKGLKLFLEQVPNIDPRSLTFHNACAMAALKLPPIFDKSRGIYKKLDEYGPAATEEEREKDRTLVTNAHSSFTVGTSNFLGSLLPIEGPGRYFHHTP